MLRLLKEIPTYAYIAGILGAAATYVLYTPGSSNKKKRKHNLHNGFPRGLINYKNECFINVILQSLASSNRVTDWLVHNRSQLTPNSLYDALSNVIGGINRIQDSTSDLDEFQTEFYAAQNIKRALNAHNWHIQSEEHDCHELFHLIMDVLDEEQLENKKSLKSLNFFQPSNLKENSRQSSSKNPFHGYLACQFQCLDCDYKYPLKLESFYSLSLTLPQLKEQFMVNGYSLNGTTLYECLNNFFKPELLVEMKCENCVKNGQVHDKRKGIIKRQAIAKLPDCLCIQIQRNSWSDSNYEMIKKTNFVQFPLTIKIDNNSSVSTNSFSLKQVGIGGLLGGRASMSPREKSPPSPKPSISVDNFYELRSAVVHYGSAMSGHFVVFRRLLQNFEDWLQISDSDVKKVKQNNLLNSNVYMLFYDKVSNIIV